MLTLPMLQNSSSSPVSPLKNSVPAADAGEARQTAATTGFSKVLAHEMNGKGNGKGDTPAEEPIDEKTAPGKAPEDTAVAAEETETRSPETSENNREGEAYGALIGAVLQPIALPGTLPGLIAGHSSAALTGNQADARAHAKTGGIANETQAGFPLGTPQAGLPTTVMSHAEFKTVHPGPFAGQPAAAATFGEPGAAAVRGITTQNAKLPVDVLADILTKPGEKTRQARAIHAVIQNDMAIKPGLTAGQAALPLEFSMSEFSLAGETKKPGKLFLEVAHQNLPAAQVESALTAMIAERGPALPSSTPPSAAPSAPVHPALGLEPHLGAAGWDNALGQKVLWMVSQQQQVAELNLNPPDLGPMQVVLSITDDQVSATFVSQQADVRQALEAALPRLKEMMADSGINLGNTTVSSDTPQQQRFEQQNRSGARYGGGGGHIVPGVDMTAGRIHSAGNNLVDTFA